MHVIFVEPAFPSNQREFPRALHAVGARITGIGEAPYDALDPELKSWLHGYEQVRSVVHEPSVLEAVQRVQQREWVDRLEATVEAHILPVAHVREQCGIPGTSVRTAFLCRDKVAMKEALRAAGIPCAQSASAEEESQVRDFVAQVGYPIILKPRGGAGASGTYRVASDGELTHALAEIGLGNGQSIALEEFIEGHEGFYDTLTVNGKVHHDFATHYYPNVLEAMRTRSVSPYFITTNRLDSSGYNEVKEMGRKVIEALGIGTSATHMEWFFGPKGLKFSEIGCRPPGVGAWDVYSAANDFDIYRDWALAVTEGRTDQTPSRGYSCAMIALRPDQEGQIVAYEGVDEILSRYANNIVAHRFPPQGSRTGGVEGGYMANAWLRVRHPDYDELRKILAVISNTIRIYAR
ncbi:MAG: ATP-grasp domain-containing protein [Candidatus Eisenbacteria bacterium]|nr:ATP-grasp domain-containing protein [Candidatus Eisenbacteria bacterium]